MLREDFMKSRHLTKSRFKVGFDCPTKLYYLDNEEYGNAKDNDEFMRMLAEGGFQVGELAKLYYEGGEDLSDLGKAEAVKRTAELMKQKDAVIYEASFQHENCYVKVDVLLKKGNSVKLIEVKAKSYDSKEPPEFFKKRSKVPELLAGMSSYVLDVAFQGWVFKNCHPDLELECRLMMADTSSKSSINGLNQKFLLKRLPNGRSKVEVEPGLKKRDLGDRILGELKVQDAVEKIWAMKFPLGTFPEVVALLSRICEKGERHTPAIGKDCKGCEFRIDDSLKKEKKSGFEECWTEKAKLKPKDFEKLFVFDVWFSPNAEELIESGTYFADQVNSISELKKGDAERYKEDGSFTRVGRQWEQIERYKNKSKEPYFDKEALASAMAKWTFPLHFIDFETARSAIPFHVGQRPYEQLAFQFSHHQVDEDGTITHKDEFIHAKRGEFPNFEFIRALKKALDKDQGTIFRYSHHENTVLNEILEQLEAKKKDVPDYKELQEFIRSITTIDKQAGPRNMVDLCKLVQQFYYHPATEGSNSIKSVLPAILNESKFLKDKYSKPIYGVEIKSHNFKKPTTWIELEKDGTVKDPYKNLEPVFTEEDLRLLGGKNLMSDELNNGGAAMMAYSRLQFTQMTDLEAERVVKALLRYCELDTLAMVMLYEYWASEIGVPKKKKKSA
jgi:Domain of unknown function(DUF2779)